MKDNSKLLLTLMFDPGEHICVSDSQFSYHSIDLETVLEDSVVLISPNEKVKPKTISTNDLVLVSLNPMKERSNRQDSNVLIFRNFLIELDNYERSLQIGYIKKLAIPYSAMIWSGGRSTHTLISLSESIEDEKTYRFIYKWILNIASLSDQQLGNPSRSIRCAGAIRPETGKEQELIELKSRISHEELFAWLNQYPHLRPAPPKPKKVLHEGEADLSLLSAWTRRILIQGIGVSKKGRNQTWYGLAYDMALVNFTEDEAIVLLGKIFQEESDFKEKEWLTTIKSAFNKVAKE